MYTIIIGHVNDPFLNEEKLFQMIIDELIKVTMSTFFIH